MTRLYNFCSAWPRLQPKAITKFSVSTLTPPTHHQTNDWGTPRQHMKLIFGMQPQINPTNRNTKKKHKINQAEISLCSAAQNDCPQVAQCAGLFVCLCCGLAPTILLNSPECLSMYRETQRVGPIRDSGWHVRARYSLPSMYLFRNSSLIQVQPCSLKKLNITTYLFKVQINGSDWNACAPLI